MQISDCISLKYRVCEWGYGRMCRDHSACVPCRSAWYAELAWYVMVNSTWWHSQVVSRHSSAMWDALVWTRQPGDWPRRLPESGLSAPDDSPCMREGAGTALLTYTHMVIVIKICMVLVFCLFSFFSTYVTAPPHKLTGYSANALSRMFWLSSFNCTAWALHIIPCVENGELKELIQQSH